MRSRAEKKLADEKAKEELKARAESKASADAAGKEQKKQEKAAKKAAFRESQKQKPVYKRRWFIIVCAIVVVVIFSQIYTAMQPKITSISAVYNGSTVEGTEVKADDFTVKAKYGNGKTEKTTDFVLENDGKTLLYGDTYVAKISCTDPNNQKTHKTTVTIKCDKLKTYTVEENMGTLKYIAKEEVSAYMKDPDSAKFRNITAVQTATNTFTVSGSVSGTNSFGATVTSPFSMSVKLGMLDENAFPAYDVSGLTINGESMS